MNIWLVNLDDISRLSNLEKIAKLQRNGDVKIEDTIQSCNDRIEQKNKQLNAVIWQDAKFIEKEIDRANSQKISSDQDLPLLGIPILAKELDSPILGTPNSWGNKQLKDAQNKDALTATSITMLQNAGAVIVGKTNNPEFGLTVVTDSAAHGPCNNPLDLKRNSGGSSGGSAAAVASGMVSVATASDGGGSARIPASNCGIFGYKPSKDLIPLGPMIDEAWGGLVCKGLLASNVDDLTLVLDVLTGAKFSFHQNSNAIFPQLRIGIRTKGFASMYQMDPSVVRATKKVADFLSDAGHQVSLSSPSTFDDADYIQHFLDIIAFNTYSDFHRLSASTKINLEIEKSDPVTQYFYSQGEQTSKNEYELAKNKSKQFAMSTQNWFDDFDILITPTCGDVAPLHGEVETDPEINPLRYGGLCFPSNVSGTPAISIPVRSEHPTSLPVGIQIIAQRDDDKTVLELAKFLESDYSDIFVTNSDFITS